MGANVVWQKILEFFPTLLKGNSGAAPAVDWTQGSVQAVTLNAATVTPTFNAPPGGCNLALIVTQDGVGGRLVAWPAAVSWAGGTPPVMNPTAGQTTIVNFYFDGATYWGSVGTIVSAYSSLVLRPGGVPGGNVFTTWAAVMSATAALSGAFSIFVDDSIAPAHGTVGLWNLDQCTLSGGLNSVLHLDPGFTFTSRALWVTGGLQLSSELTAGNAWTPTVRSTLTLLNGSSILGTGAGGLFMKVPVAATNTAVFLGDDCSLGDAAHNVFTVDVATTVLCELLTATVQAHAWAGAGTLLAVTSAGATVNAQDIATTNVIFSAKSQQVKYAPSTGANWNPGPTLVNAALDQLAAPNFKQATGNTGSPGATITVTTAGITKAKNGSMLVFGTCALSTSLAATLTLQLQRDGGNIGTPKTLVLGVAVALDTSIAFVDTALDNAAHTYTLSVSVSAGLLTVAANSAQIQVVEDS
jgi:hypothetical protein